MPNPSAFTHKNYFFVAVTAVPPLPTWQPKFVPNKVSANFTQPLHAVYSFFLCISPPANRWFAVSSELAKDLRSSRLHSILGGASDH